MPLRSAPLCWTQELRIPEGSVPGGLLEGSLLA